MAISATTKFTGPTAYTIDEMGIWLAANGYGGGGGGLTTEQAQDLVAAMVVPGSGMTATYNDTAGTLTLTATGGAGATAVPWVNVKDYGATGNGSTDDTAAIQAAINYAILNNIGTVLIPDGIYVTSDTIHVGFGLSALSGTEGYNTVRVQGSVGHGADTSIGKGRTQIKPTFKDRPIFNIQSGRESGIDKVWMTGPTTFNFYNFTMQQRADAANYVPSGAKDDQYAPFCGVAIDGYSGTAPANPYPTPTYPAGVTAPSSAYGRQKSSNCYVTNCHIEYTLVGIACQTNADGNGDFMNFRDTTFMGQKVGIAIGNTQARCTDYTKARFGGCHTCIDGLTYRNSGGGNISGDLDNMHADYCHRLLWYDATWSKGVVVKNYYSEVTNTLGGANARSTPALFIGCRISCHQVVAPVGTATSRYVAPIWYGTPAKFENCIFNDFHSLLQFSEKAEFENCLFSRSDGTPIVTGGEKTACYNYLGGVAIHQDGLYLGNQIFKNCRVVAPAGGIADYNGRDNTGLSLFHSIGTDAGAPLDYQVPMVGRFDTGALTSASYSGRTITGLTGKAFHRVNDLIYDTTNRNWFVVTSVTDMGGSSYQLVMDQLTNFSWDGTTYTLLISSGTSFSYNYYPSTSLDITTDIWTYLRTTAGNALVECINQSGAATARPTSLVAGSMPFWCGGGAQILALGLPFSTRANVVSTGTNDFTMSNPAKVSGIWTVSPGWAKIA